MSGESTPLLVKGKGGPAGPSVVTGILGRIEHPESSEDLVLSGRVDEDEGSVHEKSIGIRGSFILMVNNIVGPGMMSLPHLFHKAGIIPSCVCIALVCVCSALASTMLADNIGSLPHNSDFTQDVDFSTAFKVYAGKYWYVVVEALFLISCSVQACAAIVEAAQSLDGFLASFLLGRTYAIQLYPTLEIVSWSPAKCSATSSQQAADAATAAHQKQVDATADDANIKDVTQQAKKDRKSEHHQHQKESSTGIASSITASSSAATAAAVAEAKQLNVDSDAWKGPIAVVLKGMATYANALSGGTRRIAPSSSFYHFLPSSSPAYSARSSIVSSSVEPMAVNPLQNHKINPITSKTASRNSIGKAKEEGRNVTPSWGGLGGYLWQGVISALALSSSSSSSSSSLFRSSFIGLGLPSSYSSTGSYATSSKKSLGLSGVTSTSSSTSISPAPSMRAAMSNDGPLPTEAAITEFVTHTLPPVLTTAAAFSSTATTTTTPLVRVSLLRGDPEEKDRASLAEGPKHVQRNAIAAGLPESIDFTEFQADLSRSTAGHLNAPTTGSGIVDSRVSEESFSSSINSDSIIISSPLYDINSNMINSDDDIGEQASNLLFLGSTNLIDDCTPFQSDGGLIFTLGFFLTAVIFLPLGLGHLKETMLVQLVSFVLLMVLLTEFTGQFMLIGVRYAPPLFGRDWSQLAGVILFNYAFSITVPAWLCEKKDDVPVNRLIWSSAGLSSALYMVFGLFSASCFRHVGPNLLVLLTSNEVHPLTRFCAAAFGVSIIGAGVPIFCVIIKNALAHIFPYKLALFWGAIMPYAVSWMLYQGTALLTMLNWTGLVVNGLVAFILPMVLALMAVDARERARQKLLQKQRRLELSGVRVRLSSEVSECTEYSPRSPRSPRTPHSPACATMPPPTTTTNPARTSGSAEALTRNAMPTASGQGSDVYGTSSSNSSARSAHDVTALHKSGHIRCSDDNHTRNRNGDFDDDKRGGIDDDRAVEASAGGNIVNGGIKDLEGRENGLPGVIDTAAAAAATHREDFSSGASSINCGSSSLNNRSSKNNSSITKDGIVSGIVGGRNSGSSSSVRQERERSELHGARTNYERDEGDEKERVGERLEERDVECPLRAEMVLHDANQHDYALFHHLHSATKPLSLALEPYRRPVVIAVIAVFAFMIGSTLVCDIAFGEAPS